MAQDLFQKGFGFRLETENWPKARRYNKAIIRMEIPSTVSIKMFSDLERVRPFFCGDASDQEQQKGLEQCSHQPVKNSIQAIYRPGRVKSYVPYGDEYNDLITVEGEKTGNGGAAVGQK